MEAVALMMLGGFDLRTHGQRVPLPPTAERVIAFLAVHRGPASRPKVAGTLWLNLPEERALANLRSALWRLRRQGLAIVESRGDRLYLVDDIEVDFHQASASARRCLDGNAPTEPGQLDQLASSGDLLDDWYEDWVLLEREHFRQLRLHALERLACDLAQDGHYGWAAEIALAAVSSEPLRESAHRALISVHLAQGNRAEAIRQYCIYKRLLRDELDIEPSPMMDDLIGEVPAAEACRVMSR